MIEDLLDKYNEEKMMPYEWDFIVVMLDHNVHQIRIGMSSIIGV